MIHLPIFSFRSPASAALTALALILGCHGGQRHHDDAGPDATSAELPAASPTLARAEICNNGIDDDQDGVLDEGCVCAVGATQPCYPGWPAYAGVGVCSRGVQTCVASGSEGRWETCMGATMPGAEICGDGLDNDCDGDFDEDCPCVLGQTEACFVGAPSQEDVGVCRGGVATCERVGHLDGTSTLAWSPCFGATAPGDEVCDGLDDDCDGEVDDIPELCDLIDNDCDGEIDEGDACRALPESRALSRFWPPTGSGVLPASAPLYAMKAVAPAVVTACAAGTVPLEDSPGHFICVGPPRACPPGQHFDWSDGAWRCVSCGVLVQFGYLYDYERACAAEPRIVCDEGSSPTFDVEAREWRCMPTCHNDEYDRALSGGQLVCVPC